MEKDSDSDDEKEKDSSHVNILLNSSRDRKIGRKSDIK